MSFIECYEPEYVRKFLARHPGSPLYVRKVWKNEIRLSLSLTDIASCEAVLNDVRAFDLQLTYRPVEENAAELSARDAIVNQVILSTLTLRDLTPELSLYAVGILLSRASKMPGRRRWPIMRKKASYRHSSPSCRPCHSWRVTWPRYSGVLRLTGRFCRKARAKLRCRCRCLC